MTAVGSRRMRSFWSTLMGFLGEGAAAAPDGAADGGVSLSLRPFPPSSSALDMCMHMCAGARSPLGTGTCVEPLFASLSATLRRIT